MFRFLRDTVINIIIIAVIVVIFEIGIRIFMPQVLGSPMAEDSLLGWKNRPMSTKVHIHKDYKSIATVNAKGLRGSSDIFYEKPPGEKRILIIGDSYTWGEGVDDEETFSAYLDESLGEKGKVINAGVDGYGTDQEYLYLKNEGYKYDPDVVILAFCLNDLENNTLDISSNRLAIKPRFNLDKSVLRLHNVPIKEKGSRRGFWWDAHRYLTKHSHLYSVLRKTFSYISYKYYVDPDKKPFWYHFVFRKLEQSRLSKGYKNTGEALYFPYLKEWPADAKQSWNLTERLILETARSAEKLGAEFIVVVIPYPIEIYQQDWLKAVDKYQLNVSAYNLKKPRKMFERFGKKNDIKMLFLDELFLNERVPRLYFDRDLHFSKYGHQAAAKAIYDFLVAQRILMAD